MDLVEMVLVGRVNKSIVSLINEAGGRAVGLCGKDGRTISARQVSKLSYRFNSVARMVVAVMGLRRMSASKKCMPVCQMEVGERSCSSYNSHFDSPCLPWRSDGVAASIPLQMVEKDIGFVGEVTGVNPRLIKTLVDDDTIPVVATVASGEFGQALNINADTAAGEASSC